MRFGTSSEDSTGHVMIESIWVSNCLDLHKHYLSCMVYICFWRDLRSFIPESLRQQINWGFGVNLLRSTSLESSCAKSPYYVSSMRVGRLKSTWRVCSVGCFDLTNYHYFSDLSFHVYFRNIQEIFYISDRVLP